MNNISFLFKRILVALNPTPSLQCSTLVIYNPTIVCVFWMSEKGEVSVKCIHLEVGPHNGPKENAWTREFTMPENATVFDLKRRICEVAEDDRNWFPKGISLYFARAIAADWNMRHRRLSEARGYVGSEDPDVPLEFWFEAWGRPHKQCIMQ